MALAEIILPNWISATVGAAALLAAIAVIWKVIRKGSRLIYLIETYAPVLLAIGEEFKSNGGTSLKDKIDRIELAAFHAMEAANENRIQIAKIAATAMELALSLNANLKLINGLKCQGHDCPLVEVLIPGVELNKS